MHDPHNVLTMQPRFYLNGDTSSSEEEEEDQKLDNLGVQPESPPIMLP